MSFPIEKDRRHGKRIRLSFHVEISGIGTDGAAFCEDAAASDISERGCQITLPRAIMVGELLSLRVVRKKIDNESKSLPYLYKVAWVRVRGDAWAAGLVALEDGNPWFVNFPFASTVLK
jgi:hypothetical protein